MSSANVTPIAAHLSEQVSPIAKQVTSIRETYLSGRSRDKSWRITQLQQLRTFVLDKQDEIYAALNADLGKCKMEAWTSEMGFLVSDIDHTLKHLDKWMRPRKVSSPLVAQPAKSYQLPEPLGVVLIIGAWNYPFQLLLAPLVAAIAAGNCAVLKPSELAASTSALLAKHLPDYLDQDAFAVVEGAVPETTELLKQKFDHIIYTGGEAVGKIVMRAASEHLTPVTLELGGKSPCIVEQSADIDVAAARIVWSKWMNAGQTCVAPDYVLVDERVVEKLTVAVIKKLTSFYGKEPQKSADYGRIINQRHFARLKGYLDNQEVIHGGDGDIESRYFAPTIVRQPGLDTPLMQEEIFGPILPILTYKRLEQAVDLIKQRPKPLALYLYTKNKDAEQQVLEQTSAGNVCVNDGFMFMLNPELPFGGVGNSGMGAYHGQTGFDTFSHLKTVMKRSFWFDIPLRYPPFNRMKFNLLKKML